MGEVPSPIPITVARKMDFHDQLNLCNCPVTDLRKSDVIKSFLREVVLKLKGQHIPEGERGIKKKKKKVRY